MIDTSLLYLGSVWKIGLCLDFLLDIKTGKVNVNIETNNGIIENAMKISAEEFKTLIKIVNMINKVSEANSKGKIFDIVLTPAGQDLIAGFIKI